jgi:hypothetical protein
MRAPEDESFGMRARHAFSESLNVSSDLGTGLVAVAAASEVRLAPEDFMLASSVAQAAKPAASMAQNNPDNADLAFIDESSS